MLSIFDYVFFRFAKWFFKTDGSFGARALLLLSILQLAIIWPLVIYTLYYLSGGEGARHNSKPLIIVVLIIWSLLIISNYFRYKDKYDIFAKRWKQDTTRYWKAKGFLCIIFYFIILVLSYKSTVGIKFY